MRIHPSSQQPLNAHAPSDERPRCWLFPLPVSTALSTMKSTARRPSLLAITPINIQHCKCTHPAIALIQQGAFTSTPVNPPKWAFDLQYLAFIREQFLAGIPNFSAWCNGAVAFLTKDGCQQVPSAVSDGKGQAGIQIAKSCSSQPSLDLYPPVYSIIS